MKLNLKSLEERILEMEESELEELARSEALAMADSSRIEGLHIDQEKIQDELLAGYLAIQTVKNQKSPSQT